MERKNKPTQNPKPLRDKFNKRARFLKLGEDFKNKRKQKKGLIFEAWGDFKC